MQKPAAAERYYQFPLYALAFVADPVTRLRAIVNWCIVETGRKAGEGMTLAEMREAAEEMDTTAHPAGVKASERSHLAVLIGMDVLGVKGGSVQTVLTNHAALTAHVAALTASNGPGPFVRLRSDIVWGGIAGTMDYRRLAVFAAVVSVVGSKTYPVRITRERIIAGAMGYKNAAMMTAEMLAMRTDGAQPLTENQARRTLDEIERDSLITRVQVSRRRVLFSTRMDADEIRSAAIETATRRAAKVKNLRQTDRELMGAIKAVKVAKQSPPSNHSVTTR
jgi:hypothetical protein